MKFSAISRRATGVTAGQLEGQVADRAAAKIIRALEQTAVSFKNPEDTLDGVTDAIKNRLDDLRPEQLLVQLEHRDQQVFLGREEIVKAAAAGVGRLENLRNARSGITVLPEEHARRRHQPIASLVLHCGHLFVERSIKMTPGAMDVKSWLSKKDNHPRNLWDIIFMSFRANEPYGRMTIRGVICKSAYSLYT